MLIYVLATGTIEEAIMVKFRVFNLRQVIVTEEKQKGLLGGETTIRKETFLYRTTQELYAAVAQFASEVGDRLITISGTPYGEDARSYLVADIVAWYHE
jgi:hypothetical protein